MDLDKTIQQISDIWQKQISIKLKNSSLTRFNQELGKFNFQHKYLQENIIWQQGATRLVKFAGKGEKAVLIIPSLINKSYIFDLQKNNSFAKFLQNSGLDIYIIDWGEPLESEIKFDIEDYICKRVDKIIEFICGNRQGKVSLLGHCLGGLMAIAGAIENEKYVSSLALISTPWDFHHKKFARFDFDDDAVRKISDVLKQNDLISASLIHSIFCYFNIDAVINKFDKFNSLMQKSDSKAEIENFLSIESWINDGISMPSNLARTCFIDFSHYNHTKKLKWKIKGNIIDPRNLQIPVLFINSKKDKIVPHDSTLKLIGLVDNYSEILIDMGHVAMVSGLKAKENTWQPYLKWLSINM